MSFNVSCPECQKRYAADERMVGKRIRCRQCGTVFPVVAAARADAAKLKPAAVGAGGGGAGGSMSGSSVSGSSVTAMAHQNLVEDDPIAAARGGGDEPVFTNTETASTGSFMRGSRPQPFPASRILERWVPLALPAILALWAVQESFGDDHSGKTWVPIFRLLVVAAIFLGVAVPLTLRGAYQGLKMYRYAPPPKPYWRAAATFCLPATLGFVLWMVGGSPFNFIAGCVVGVVLASPVYWLLFRQEWAHAGVSYAIAGGTFLLSAVIGMFLMAGVNFGLNQIFIAAHKADTFRHSPLNDSLSWTVPPPRQPVPIGHPGKDASVAQQTSDTNAATSDAAPPQQPAADSRSHAESTSPPPNSLTPAQARPAVASATRNDAVPQSVDSAHTGASSPEKLFTSNEPGASVPDSLVGRIKAANRPWITAVTACDEIAENRFVLPVVPSPYIGIIRHQASGGVELECCALNPYTRVGTVPLISPTEDSAGFSRYAISPDGKQLLRLGDFPHYQIEVESFDRPGEILSKTPLAVALLPFNDRSMIPDRTFTPQLLGALPDHHVLVRWVHDRQDIDILEVWDYQHQVNKLRRLARPSTGGHPSANYAVSPDGKWFATTASDPTRNFLTMWVYSLGGPRAPLTFPIPEMDAQRWDVDPVGIAFAPDGHRLAVLFERDGEGFIITWDLEATRRIRDTVCPLPTARAVTQMGGSQRALSWLTDDVLLVHGVTLLQASTGAVIGSLTDDAVIAQQVADSHTFYLAYPEGGSTHLATVSFDANKLPVVPQEKRRIIP